MPLLKDLYYFDNGGNGNRPPVILIHGAGGTHLYWPPEIRRLKNQHILAIDLPGHGKSSGIGKQSIADYGHSVMDFMQSLKINKAIFIGHSMGGAIALWLGIHHPASTLGLGLVSTSSRLRVSPLLLSTSSTHATMPLAVKALVELSFGSQIDSRTKELSAQRLGETRHTVLHGDFTACSAFDESKQAGKIKCPVLILCGNEDQMTPVKFSEDLHAGIKKSRLEIIQGAGHMVMLEKPLQTAGHLESFLNDIPYQPGSSSITE
ncbi:MAG: alpha/beta hydrolase [Chloroflexota bacterium]